MKVTFRQSGGFPGLIRGCELETSRMEKEEGRILRELVERCPVQAVETPSGTARDQLLYEITIEEGQSSRKLSFEEPAVPEGAAPLIAFLAARSAPRRY